MKCGRYIRPGVGLCEGVVDRSVKLIRTFLYEVSRHSSSLRIDDVADAATRYLQSECLDNISESARALEAALPAVRRHHV